MTPYSACHMPQVITLGHIDCRNGKAGPHAITENPSCALAIRYELAGKLTEVRHKQQMGELFRHRSAHFPQ
jgi:hypothetical protein